MTIQSRWAIIAMLLIFPILLTFFHDALLFAEFEVVAIFAVLGKCVTCTFILVVVIVRSLGRFGQIRVQGGAA